MSKPKEQSTVSLPPAVTGSREWRIVKAIRASKHKHVYRLVDVRLYRDPELNRYCQHTYSCGCGAGKYERERITEVLNNVKA